MILIENKPKLPIITILLKIECSIIDSRYSGSMKYGHLDILAIWLGTEC